MALFGIPSWCCIKLCACMFVCFPEEFSCKLATVNGELNRSQNWLSNSLKKRKNDLCRELTVTKIYPMGHREWLMRTGGQGGKKLLKVFHKWQSTDQSLFLTFQK